MAENIAIAVGDKIRGHARFIGEVETVSLDPSGQSVVEVTMRPSHEGGVPRHVPIRLLVPSSEGLRLDCSREEFEQLPPVDGAHD